MLAFVIPCRGIFRMDQPAPCPHTSWSGMLDELRAARLRGASAAERLLLIEHWRQQRCTGCTLTCLHPVPELPPALRQHYSRRPR